MREHPSKRAGMSKASKRASMSKQKGAKYERQTCERLSLWVTNRTRDDVFWRSAMSGGRATFRKRKTPFAKPIDSAVGDVSCVHPAGSLLLRLFVVECKHYRDLQFTELCYGVNSAKAGTFWRELGPKCESSRHPFLVLRQNNRPDMILTSKHGWEMLKVGDPDLPAYATFPRMDGAVLLHMRDVLGVDFDLMRRHFRRYDEYRPPTQRVRLLGH